MQTYTIFAIDSSGRRINTGWIVEALDAECACSHARFRGLAVKLAIVAVLAN